jgi:DNA polymerase III subunit delta
MAKDDKAKPVYVLAGGDSYLLDKRRREIVEQVIDGGDPQLAMRIFDGAQNETIALADVLDELRTVPFLAPHRLVIIRDADEFVSENRDKLEGYLDAPSATASLMLIAPAWKTNTRLHKLVLKIGEFTDCSTPGGSAMAVLGQLGREVPPITPAATQMLVDHVAGNLLALSNELEKLSLYTAGRQITERDVETLVADTAGAADFALTNALMAGDTAAALKTLGQEMRKRGDEFRLLGQIQWHLRKVLKAQQLLAAGKNGYQAVGEAGIFQQKEQAVALLRRRPLAKLQQDMRKMIRVDLGLKSGLEPKAAMEELIVALCV